MDEAGQQELCPSICDLPGPAWDALFSFLTPSSRLSLLRSCKIAKDRILASAERVGLAVEGHADSLNKLSSLLQRKHRLHGLSITYAAHWWPGQPSLTEGSPMEVLLEAAHAAAEGAPWPPLAGLWELELKVMISYILHSSMRFP